MAYVTQSDLEKRFALLRWWTDDAAAGAISATIVVEAIALAAAEIDAAASQQYSTPLAATHATTAALLRDKAGTIAGYKLATRRRELDSAEALRTDYEDALKWLKELAAGRVHLPGETAVLAAKPAGGIIVAGGTKVVDRETMDGL